MARFAAKGIIPAMATPTDKWGTLNEGALRKLVNHLIDGGVHGLFPVGSQGEFFALPFESKKRILEVVVDETRGRVPVYAGTAAMTTQEAIETTKMAQDIGVDAVSILTPWFTDLSQKEVINHYVRIAEAVPKLPIL
ncbi:MAG: dihydrodipicolinate synthase family protein, partial [Firmicutes bacterium]|nr:dihydrodipicolinate synthase family protein [Bacillota bacterium]